MGQSPHQEGVISLKPNRMNYIIEIKCPPGVTDIICLVMNNLSISETVLPQFQQVGLLLFNVKRAAVVAAGRTIHVDGVAVVETVDSVMAKLPAEVAAGRRIAAGIRHFFELVLVERVHKSICLLWNWHLHTCQRRGLMVEWLLSYC